MVVLVWKTDKDLNPIGKEWYLKGKSMRDCISHISYTQGGKVSSNGKSIKFPDGTRAFATIIEK